ncbi:MAG: hypothetical protein EOM65_16950, partial [Synergistales bacterium]|nr:hypothetical protein [Synergistales bacterium]
MASDEWQDVLLGDLVHIKHGWAFKSKCFSEELSGKPIVVNIGNFRYTGGFRFESTTVKEYTAEYPRDFELRPGEILLVMTCQTAGGEILGIPARVPNDGKTYLHNQRLGKVEVLHPDRVDEAYLYWLFLSPTFNRHLFVTATGTKILHTAPQRIESFRFRLPPLPEQRRIAHILGTLDDKIELNRRMNETLEAMAQALFKSWFVDFDPVIDKALAAGNPIPDAFAQRAAQRLKFGGGSLKGEAGGEKLEGGNPGLGLDPSYFSLFPSTFQDSPLGPIPEGWRPATIAECCVKVQNGGTPKRSKEAYWLPGTIPWLTSGEVRQTVIVGGAEQLVGVALT